MNEAPVETRSCPALGIDLCACDEILYKFTVGSRSQIPTDIREISRPSDKKMDQKHANEAKQAGLYREATDGLVRPGRVDTGIAVYQNVERVRIGSIRSLLALEGFALVDVHFFQKPGSEQCVIVMLLSQEGEPMKLLHRTIEALRKLARENVWKFHGWDNSNLGKPATLNFTSKQQGNPECMLVVRNGFLQVTDLEGVNAVDLEASEDRKMGRNLVELLETIK